MCRIAGFFGFPLALSKVLSDPEHSLRHQGLHPRELPAGMLGSDGYGFAWVDDDAPEAARYRSVLPIWSDPNLDTLAPYVRAGCFVASTRTAAASMPVAITNTPPFCSGRTMFVHNGTTECFHEGMIEDLRAQLAPEVRRRVLGNTDSEYFAALLMQARGEALEARVRDMLRAASGAVRRAGTEGQLNVIAADGHQLVAARFAVGRPAPSLYLSQRDGVGTFVASEPLAHDASWTKLPERTLVVATRDPQTGSRVVQHALAELTS